MKLVWTTLRYLADGMKSPDRVVFSRLRSLVCEWGVYVMIGTMLLARAV